MNDQTLKLAERLAQKSGTTAEYLWQVLLKQAPISAAIDLMYFVLAIIGGFVIYRLNKHFLKLTAQGNNIYKEQEWIAIIMFVCLVVCAAMIMVCFLSFGNIINGFFNPEYWALDKILSSCK